MSNLNDIFFAADEQKLIMQRQVGCVVHATRNARRVFFFARIYYDCALLGTLHSPRDAP